MSRQIFGGAKDYCPKSPKLARKKTPKNVISKKNLLGAICFKSKQVERHFCSPFLGICSDFHGFCEGFQRFCRIYMDFARILRDFAP